MKRILLFVLCLLLMSGCSSGKEALDAGHELRSNILQSSGCSFLATVTADYGEELYSFDMLCSFDKNGEMVFEIQSPDSISGISGKIDSQSGSFTFDDQMVAFKTFADGQITPVTAPWVLMKAVRGGYISACTKENTGYYLQLDDSYAQDPLTVDLWLDCNKVISSGELLWDGHRILSVKVSDFKLL